MTVTLNFSWLLHILWSYPDVEINQNSISHLFYCENENKINVLLSLHELLSEWVVNATVDLAKQAQREMTVITLPAVFQQIHGP